MPPKPISMPPAMWRLRSPASRKLSSRNVCDASAHTSEPPTIPAAAAMPNVTCLLASLQNISSSIVYAYGATSDSDSGRLLCRSEEHTSELQSRVDLVCRLLLEKKKE